MKDIRMNDTTYNGWTNYATWRINSEMFDGFDPSDKTLYYISVDPSNADELGQSLKQYAEEIASLVSDVNWHELAERMIAYYAEEK